MTKWFAVHTKPRKEALVHSLLERQGFDSLYLHYSAIVKHARCTRQVMRAHFPRYVFAGVGGGLSVFNINRTIGVSTVVYLGDQPLEIPTPVIDELRRRGDKTGLVKLTPAQRAEHRKRFRQGEQVRVVNGPLAGLFAVVSLDKGDEVRVWLNGFGGKVEALFDPTGLKSGSPAGGLVEIPRRRRHG